MLRDLRQAIVEDRAETFAVKFFNDYYRDEGVPQWIKNALNHCGI